MRAAGTLTVFAIGQDAQFRSSLQPLAEAAGFRVVALAGAEDFLAAYSPEQPACLILETELPGMSGLELLDELIYREWSIPAIFVTAHGTVPLAVSAVKKGALQFLEKPVRDAVVLEHIVQALKLDAQQRREQTHRAALAMRFRRLTPREHEVMNRIVAGKMNKLIADELGVSVKTVEVHRARVMKKLEVDSIAALVRLAMEAKHLRSQR